MSTTRLSFGAVLGTVQSAATTLTSTLDTVTTAVGMATSFVTQAADNQRLRQIADKEDFVRSLTKRTSSRTSSWRNPNNGPCPTSR